MISAIQRPVFWVFTGLISVGFTLFFIFVIPFAALLPSGPNDPCPNNMAQDMDDNITAMAPDLLEGGRFYGIPLWDPDRMAISQFLASRMLPGETLFDLRNNVGNITARLNELARGECWNYIEGSNVPDLLDKILAEYPMPK